jgi:hypothetical protein
VRHASVLRRMSRSIDGKFRSMRQRVPHAAIASGDMAAASAAGSRGYDEILSCPYGFRHRRHPCSRLELRKPWLRTAVRDPVTGRIKHSMRRRHRPGSMPRRAAFDLVGSRAIRPSGAQSGLTLRPAGFGAAGAYQPAACFTATPEVTRSYGKSGLAWRMTL